ncbi:MAG: ankyrin repeat domain-containing protein [Elioraea sp.]|nr:ankyrin repeat domain-containing protein [Elioraea sp.]
MNPLHRRILDACHMGCLPLLAQCLRLAPEAMHADGDRHPLLIAAGKGYAELCLQLIHGGADPNAIRDRHGRTPLAAAVSSGSERTVLILLCHGASPAVADDEGTMPIHVAALANAARILHQLVRHGSPVDPQDRHGNTPLHVAALARAERAIHALLEHGASLSARNRDGLRPCDYLPRGTRLAKILRTPKGLVESVTLPQRVPR